MSTTPTALAQPATSLAVIRAPKIMLLGGPTSGKTTSLRTLAAEGISVRIIATEYPDILLDTPCKPGKQMVKMPNNDGTLTEREVNWGGIHWKYHEPGRANWTTLLDNAKLINNLSNDALQKLPGVNKDKYRQFMDVISTCNKFVCERCGQDFGDASTWGTDTALVMDSLSGLSIMARDLAVGAKPIITQPDWGVMMQNLEAFLNAAVTGTKAWFILTAHLESESDEASRTTKLMASTLGRKLAPKLPRFFSDVILCRREGTKWVWDVTAGDVDVKTRNLPYQGGGSLVPSFKQINDAWKARQK